MRDFTKAITRDMNLATELDLADSLGASKEEKVLIVLEHWALFRGPMKLIKGKARELLLKELKKALQ